MKTIRDAEVSGKVALVRVDYNVTVGEDGTVGEDIRVTASIPTLKYLLDNNAKVIILSHMGRPEGVDPEFSLKPVQALVERLLGEAVLFSEDPTITGEGTKALIAQFKESDTRVMLLENVRYRQEDADNDEAFSQELAGLADLFVMDAFGASHRKQSSTYGVANYIQTYCGLLLEKEVKYLGDVISNPDRPFCVAVGGSKVSDKIEVFMKMLETADCLLIGGAMAFTFLAATGVDVGTSKLEKEKIELAGMILEKAQEENVNFLLPLDVVCSESFDGGNPEIYDVEEIPANQMGLDIGPKTIEAFKAVISQSNTILFNGPMGVFENPIYANGTAELFEAMANSGAVTIVGGGDSAAAASVLGFDKQLTHISTGGGASLEMLEGKVLPGVEICNW
ncbi:MAG: phosphoglycerate kinase [Eubacteriaceae bacterium]|nr:phosphoglycerate kinase [Eubacteriaceae bacterium]